jgi:hypothetical protein
LSPHSEIQCASSITSNCMRVCQVLDKNTFFQWGFNKRKLKLKYTFNMKDLNFSYMYTNIRRARQFSFTVIKLSTSLFKKTTIYCRF